MMELRIIKQYIQRLKKQKIDAYKSYSKPQNILGGDKTGNFKT